MRNSLIIIILLSLTITSVFVQEGSALESIDENNLEPEILSNSIVDTAEDGASDIWEEVKSSLSTVFNTILGALLAPFRAFETLTENWAESLSSWYAPILAGAVLIILLVMWRGFSLLDKIIDTTS